MSPHTPVCKQTLSITWIRKVLQLAGIDTTIFKSYSTRSASTSAAHAANVPIATILKTAGWASDCVFKIFYKKALPTKLTDDPFDQVLLQNHVTAESM